jgi:hypothetical protein
MTTRWIAVAGVLAVAVTVAGCGSGKKSSKAATNRQSTYQAPSGTGVSQQAAQQDAAAKAAARSLVAEVEACFVDQQSYASCTQPSGTQADLGSGAGQVEVSEAADATYAVVAHSRSGTSFTIAKDAGGALTRTCDKQGQGGCQAGGVW